MSESKTKASKPTQEQPTQEQPDTKTETDFSALFGLSPAELLAVKDYGDVVVSVTTSGQKLQADKQTGKVINLLSGDAHEA